MTPPLTDPEDSRNQKRERTILPMRKSAEKPPAPFERAEGQELPAARIPRKGNPVGLRFGAKPMTPDAVEIRGEDVMSPKQFMRKWYRLLGNPAIILALLFGVFGVLVVVGRYVGIDFATAGRASLAAVFLFTALGHFFKGEELRRMMPRRIPRRRSIVLLVGVAELIAVPMLIIEPLKTGVCLLLFLVLATPANIYAAIKRIPFGGHELGPKYLFLRLPIQALLIAWTIWFCLILRVPPVVAS